MANHKSALKRARQNEIRRIRNKGYSTKVKNAIKQVRDDIVANSADDATISLVKAVSTLQKNVNKKIIHKNTAARKISRLTRHVNQLNAKLS